MAAAFASGNEDNIALAGVDIIVLKDKELVNAILLKHGDFDYNSDWADETPIKDNVLLSANLDRVKCELRQQRKGPG